MNDVSFKGIKWTLCVRYLNKYYNAFYLYISYGHKGMCMMTCSIRNTIRGSVVEEYFLFRLVSSVRNMSKARRVEKATP